MSLRSHYAFLVLCNYSVIKVKDIVNFEILEITCKLFEIIDETIYKALQYNDMLSKDLHKAQNCSVNINIITNSK